MTDYKEIKQKLIARTHNMSILQQQGWTEEESAANRYSASVIRATEFYRRQNVIFNNRTIIGIGMS
jgi:hypothetical protein